MTNTIDSVWKKIDKRGQNDCWPWLGYRNFRRKTGEFYGRIDILGIPGIYAHRVAYLSANPGSITLRGSGGVYVLHKCDNPGCCNPAHLYLGDHAQNMRDKVERDRCPKYHGAFSPRAKLTEEDVRDIREKKKAGATKKALAMLYEVSLATISGVCYGRHYKDVT